MELGKIFTWTQRRNSWLGNQSKHNRHAPWSPSAEYNCILHVWEHKDTRGKMCSITGCSQFTVDHRRRHVKARCMWQKAIMNMSVSYFMRAGDIPSLHKCNKLQKILLHTTSYPKSCCKQLWMRGTWSVSVVCVCVCFKKSHSNMWAHSVSDMLIFSTLKCQRRLTFIQRVPYSLSFCNHTLLKAIICKQLPRQTYWIHLCTRDHCEHSIRTHRRFILHSCRQ